MIMQSQADVIVWSGRGTHMLHKQAHTTGDDHHEAKDTHASNIKDSNKIFHWGTTGRALLCVQSASSRGRRRLPHEL